MNSKINGAVASAVDEAQPAPPAPPQPSALELAMQRHGRALLALNTVRGPRGEEQFAVDPRQLMVDLELATVRLEVLFLALIRAGVIDGANLTAELASKLENEALQMEQGKAHAARIDVAPASLADVLKKRS